MLNKTMETKSLKAT